MSEHENNNKVFIPLKFTPLTFQTPTGIMVFNNSPRLNPHPSGLPQSDNNHQPPGTPKPMNPPSSQSQLAKPVKVTSSSGSSKTHSLNCPPSSPRVIFPFPSSASSAPLSGSNNQKVPKPRTKIKPPLQPVQQNNVQMEAEEKGQVESKLQGLFEQVQLFQNSKNYEQLMESFQQTGKNLEKFGKNQSTLFSLMQEIKRISVEMLADHQKTMKEKEEKDVSQSREEQLLAQLKSMTEERDRTQHKLNETIRERDQAILEIDRIILEQSMQCNHYDDEIANLAESYNNMLNERDKVARELAEEKSRTQAMLNDLNNWRDQKASNQTSSSNLPSRKQEKRLRVDTQVETNGSLPPTPTTNVDVLEISLSANRPVSTGTNSRKTKRGVSKNRKALN